VLWLTGGHIPIHATVSPISDIQAVRAALHESIENIDDMELLATIGEITRRKYTPGLVPKLSAMQVGRIDEAKNQISRGECLTNEEADRLMDKWLNG
jgi:hypothetical protein